MVQKYAYNLPHKCPHNCARFITFLQNQEKRKTLQTIDLQGFDVWVRRFELTTALILLYTQYAGVKENQRFCGRIFNYVYLFSIESKGIKGKEKGKLRHLFPRQPPP